VVVPLIYGGVSLLSFRFVLALIPETGSGMMTRLDIRRRF
jgi:hypothetical protein